MKLDVPNPDFDFAELAIKRLDARRAANRYRLTMRRPTHAMAICLLFFAAAGAQTRPPRNYEDRGACPFECCTDRERSVKEDTVLYPSRSTKSRVAFRA